MSFDVFLTPLGEIDSATVREALDSTNHSHADVHGAEDPSSGLMLNHITEEGWNAVFALGAAGPFAIMPVGCGTFVTDRAHLARIPDEFPNPVAAISSGGELQQAVERC